MFHRLGDFVYRRGGVVRAVSGGVVVVRAGVGVVGFRKVQGRGVIAAYTGPGAGVGGSAISVLAGGDAAVSVQVNAQVAKSLALAEGIAVPLILVLLLFAFGSVVSALLPLAIGGLAILATFAELFILGSVTNVSVYSISLTTQLGLGLGIDYALLMVSRFREQLAAGQDVHEAVVS